MNAWAIAAWTLVRDTAFDSLRLWRTAIWIPLLVVVPELAQHAAEIKLGMFAGLDAFKALQHDSLRWTFGMVKLAGLFAAIFAAMRYWSRRQGLPIAWRGLGVAVLGNSAATAVMFGLERVVTTSTASVINLILSIATLPLLAILFGALLGDRSMDLAAAYRRGWWPLLRIVVLAAMVWLPLSLVHRFDHTAAFGQPLAIAWLLMVWDALLVGIMACWAGAAIHHGYFGPDKRA